MYEIRFETEPRVFAACRDVLLLTLWVMFRHDAFEVPAAVLDESIYFQCETPRDDFESAGESA